MPRFVLLSVVDASLVASAPIDPTQPALPPVTKTDVVPEFVGSDTDGHFTFNIPAFDPASQNAVSALHVSLFDKPADGSAATIPTDPAEIVKTPLSYSTVVTAAQTIVVDATAAPEGSYSAALVAEYTE